MKVDHGLVSPDWAPLTRLLRTILVRVEAELGDPGPVCLSVSTASPEGALPLIVLGEGAGLIEAQVDQLGGPVAEAVATGLPIAVTDLWADPRWPALTRSAVTSLLPEKGEVWTRIQGMAVLPAGRLDGSAIVLACCLPKPADEDTLRILGCYRQLVESAIALAHATASDGPEKVLRILAGRAIIEQAKGAIVAVTGAGPAQAWRVLRETSQRNNIKLRDLAVALVEYLGREPAEPPVGLTIETGDPRAGALARDLWRQLMTHPEPR